jgi:TPR repeat protein
MKQANELKPDELKKMYEENNFGSHSFEEVFNSSKYNYNALKSAPFFGEETLGVYLKIYERLGEMGFSPAFYELGLLYYNGEWWLEQDLKKSTSYHKKAAELGNADAMFELYVYYSTGIGVEKNDKVAIEWCIKAAEKEQSRACYNLGAYYATGGVVPKDAGLSLKWYEKASELGNGKASATLGVMYKTGDEVPQDDDKAEEYFDLSEEQYFDVDEFLSGFGIERDGGGGTPW